MPDAVRARSRRIPGSSVLPSGKCVRRRKVFRGRMSTGVAGERVAEQVAGINERSHGGFAVAAADADAHEAAFAVLQARQAAQQEQQRARQRRLDSTRQRQQRR